MTVRLLLRFAIALICLCSCGSAWSDSQELLSELRALHRRSQPDSVRITASAALRYAPFDVAGAPRRDLLAVWGQCEASFGRGASAESPLREALSLSRELGDEDSTAALLRWLGVSLGLQGRVDEADSLYSELLTFATRLGDDSLMAWAHVGTGWCALQRGELQRSVEENRLARELHHRSGSAVGYGWAMNTEAIALRRLGQFQQARELYLDTIGAASTLEGASMLLGMATGNLGHLEMVLGDPESAIEAFREAERIHSANQHLRESALIALDRASTYIALDRPLSAASLLDSLQVECARYGWRDLEVRAATQSGIALQRMGRAAEALTRFRGVLQDPDANSSNRSAAEQGRRDILLERGMASEVLVELEGLTPSEDPAVNARRLTARARALRSLGRGGEGFAALRPLLEAGPFAELAGADQLDLLIESARCARASGDPSSARARLTSAATIWESYRIDASTPRWRELRTVWASGIFLPLALFETEDPTITPLSIFGRIQSAKARTLIERVTGPDTSGRRIPIPDPGRTLLDGEVFLDLYTGQDASLLFLIDDSNVRIHRTASAGTWRTILQRLESLGDQPEHFAEAQKAVRERLLGPFSDSVSEARQVYWSPDGPFLGSTGILDPNWAIIPSWGVLTLLREKDGPVDGQLLTAVVGTTNLHYATLEHRWLQRRYESHPMAAGAPWFADQVAVAHFAGHVAPELSAPWSTRLQIRLDDGTVDSWPAWRIASQEGAPPIVVLSGCSTISGREIQGEGLSGLATAFFVAGTRCVVATHRPVEDAFAMRFVRTFYEQLDQGLDVGAALSVARETHRSNSLQEQTFVVLGDPTPTVHIRRR